MPSSARVARARLGGMISRHPDADHTDLRRNLQAAKLEDHIRKVVNGWPPLTDEQRDRLALLLRPANSGPP